MGRPLQSVVRLSRLLWVILSSQFVLKSMRDPVDRAQWQRNVANRMLAALDIKVIVEGSFPKSGLVVSNHIGYLDVIALASRGAVVFVSKSDVRVWPLIGRLLRHAGTILAYRGEPLKSAGTAREINTILRGGLPVVLFPEGTSTDGRHVLTFRSPLFEPAHQARVSVTPVGISYSARRGDPATEIAYWGEHSLFPHIIRLASLEGVAVRLRIGSAESIRSDRKTSAVYFHGRVAALVAGDIHLADRESI